MYKQFLTTAGGCAVVLSLAFLLVHSERRAYASDDMEANELHEDTALGNAAKMIAEGRHTFCFDAFGDEAFWSDTLKLHSAIERANSRL